MNNWLLLILLVGLFVVFYLFHNKRIGPSNIFVMTFLVPLIIVLFYDSFFSYEIGSETIIILCSILIVFHLFEYIPLVLSKYHKQKNLHYRIVIKKKWLWGALIIVLVNLIVKYKYIMAIGAHYGASNLISSIASARLMLVEYANTGNAEISVPYYSILLSLIAGMINILCIHIYLYKRIILKELDWFVLSIVFLNIISLIFSTGRAAFFPVAVHIFYLLIIFYNLSAYIVSFIRIHLLKFSFVLLGAFLLFTVLGALREDKEGAGDVDLPTDFVITTYAGAPILGLDVYVKGGMKRAYYFGEHAFRDYYDYARILGVPYKRSQFHKDDFYVGKGGSNVYTGLFYWLSDFGYWGALLYSAFLGFIFGLFYSRSPRLENVAGCYYRSYFYYALILMFYDDQFNNIWGVMMIVTLIVVSYFQKKIFVPVLS